MYDQFPNGLKKVAKYFLANPEAFALNSADKVSKEIKVSETTVLRFCYALDFGSFSAFQKEIREHLLNRTSSLFEYQSHKSEMSGNQDFPSRLMLRDAELISQTAQRLNIGDFDRAVDRLAQADRVLVSGVRSSHAVAHWFSFTLELIRENVRLYRPDADDLILRLRELNGNSVFVAFSFHRYAVETIHLAREAKRTGAYVIGITDSEVSPIKDHVDVLFTVQLPKKSTIDVGPAVFSLMNAIVGGVSVRVAEPFKERLQSYEDLKLDRFFVD